MRVNMEDKITSIGGGKVFQLFDYLKHQKELNINGAKAKFFWQLATVNCQDYQFTVARRDNIYTYMCVCVCIFYAFCWVLCQRGSEEEINKKMHTVWLMGKKKFDARCVVKLCGKIDKVTF